MTLEQVDEKKNELAKLQKLAQRLFGFRLGTKTNFAAAMYMRPEGASNNEICSALGGPYLNLLKTVASMGFKSKKERTRLENGRLTSRYWILSNDVVGENDRQLDIATKIEGGINSLLNKKEVKSMTKIIAPAARVRQGNLVLYTTSIQVRDIVSDGFYSVEKLDPENVTGKGYQRLLNVARAKRLADYIVDGQDTDDAFLPTSVFLATDKLIPFDETKSTIEIDASAVGPFSVVDGQHRLEGLKMASAKDARVLDFEIPVNIAAGLPYLHQMAHFLIVNTTQKSVDKAVEQRIIARLTDSWELDHLPNLPKWIRRIVEKGEVDRAVKLTDYLNNEEDSPWRGKISMANSDKNGATINQRSFVKAIERYVLTANNPLMAIFRDPAKENKAFLNYWKAIARCLDDGGPSVLYKYIGVELFCKFSAPFFMKLQDRGSYTVEAMHKLLFDCLDSLEGDYAGLAHPDWWASGSAGGASFINSGAINQISRDMAAALHRSSGIEAIEL